MTGAAVSAAFVLATTRPQLSLVAEPARVQLDGPGSQTVQVTNHGSAAVVLDAQRAGFALDLAGRPRIVSAARAAWLSVRPKRIAIAPGDAATLTVTGRVLRGAAPGDHASLLLLASRPLARGTLSVRMRLGIVVVLRVPGRVVHRLQVVGARARKAGRARIVSFRVVNRGNVAEVLRGPPLQVMLWRRGRLVARLTALPRELLPGGRALVEVRYRGRLRGPIVARLGRKPAGRRFRLRF
jgi:hypothetical protein